MIETYDDLCRLLRNQLDISPDAAPIPLKDLASMLARYAWTKGQNGACDDFMVLFATYIDDNRPKEFKPPALDRLILAYMGTRCAVSSQHKLPGIQELQHSAGLSTFYDDVQIADTVDDMIKEGRLYKYGPYLSDRQIDVL